MSETAVAATSEVVSDAVTVDEMVGSIESKPAEGASPDAGGADVVSTQSCPTCAGTGELALPEKVTSENNPDPDEWGPVGGRELTDEEKQVLADDPVLAEKYERHGAWVFQPGWLFFNEEETNAGVEKALARIGCTMEELKAQAESGRFQSSDARMTWMLVGHRAE